MPASPATEKHSVFISYAHEDAAFVRNLVLRLQNAGIEVSYDDAEEMQIGDRLTTQLRGAIDRHDYLAVVLSPDSVTSSWVKQEIEWAVQAEVDGRIKILPVLARPCEIPLVLRDRLQGDSTDPDLEEAWILALIRRLGGDWQAGAAELYPLLNKLAIASTEETPRSHPVTKAVADAPIPASVIRRFALALVPKASDGGLLVLASVGLRLIARSDLGHEIFRASFQPQRLPAGAASKLTDVALSTGSDDALLAWHDAFVRNPRESSVYNELLKRRGEFLLTNAYEGVAAYVAWCASRGPGDFGAEIVMGAITATDKPGSFVQVLRDWIHDGRFDGRSEDGNVDPKTLYLCLIDGLKARPEVVKPIVGDAIDHAMASIMRMDDAGQDVGLNHLEAMLETKVPFAQQVLDAKPRDAADPSLSSVIPTYEDALRELAGMTASGKGAYGDLGFAIMQARVARSVFRSGF